MRDRGGRKNYGPCCFNKIGSCRLAGGSLKFILLARQGLTAMGGRTLDTLTLQEHFYGAAFRCGK